MLGFKLLKTAFAFIIDVRECVDCFVDPAEFGDGPSKFHRPVSRFNRQRPEFEHLLDQLRPGDTVVVWKFDRLARSTRNLLNTMETIMETINDAGAKFQSLSEPWANTTTHAGR